MSHNGRISFVLNSVERGRGFRVRGVVNAGDGIGVAEDDLVNPADGGLRKTNGIAVGEGVAGEAVVSVCNIDKRLARLGEGMEVS